MIKKIIAAIIVLMIIIATLACSNDVEITNDETTTTIGEKVTTIEETTTTIGEEITTVEETTIVETTTEEVIEAIPEETTRVETVKVEDPIPDVVVEKTATPSITGTVNMSASTICVTGKCEKNAQIIIRGGETEVIFNSSDIYFMGTVEVPNTGMSIKLQVSAIVDGKEESDSVSVNAMYLAQVKRIRDDSFEVIVGSDSQGHFVSALPDYEGTNLMQDGQITSLTSRIQSRVKWLEENTNDTELIYVLVPNSMTVFPETVPDKYTKYDGETRSAQFVKAAEAAGATVINVTDALISHKNDGYKLFHKTDSHWTEYGAWVAYTEIMNYISQTWEDAVPRTFDEMGFYTKDVDGGDMPYYLGLDTTKVREVTVFSNPKFDLPVTMLKYVTDHGLNMNHDTTPKYKDIKSNRDNLPSAYIMRDSYGIALYDMLAERFNRTVYESMWSYGFDTDKIKSLDVDYVIIIIAERNLGDVLY